MMALIFEQARRHLAQWGLTAETVGYLLAARLALAVFSFEQLTWFFERPTRQPELSGEARARARKEVGAAIYRVRRTVLPDQTTCFHRAIAAQAMLRRRRVSTTLYYGAARTKVGLGVKERALATHVWLQDGAEGVVGDWVAKRERFNVLARYPESQNKVEKHERGP